MKKKILLSILIIFIGCKKNNLKISEKKIIKADFFSYIDKDMRFQEDIEDSLKLYAWTCKIENKKVVFSGKIFLKPKRNNLKKWSSVKMRNQEVEFINHNLNKQLFKDYRILAIITDEKYFNPINDTIDNPCEYYKKDKKDKPVVHFV